MFHRGDYIPDVSHWQGDINWELLSQQVDVVLMKATEGTGFVDPQFDSNLFGAKKNGILVITYHYFRTTYNPLAQAIHFRDVVKGSVDGAAGDFEEERNPITGAEDGDFKVFMEYCANEIDDQSIIYSNKKSWNGRMVKPSNLYRGPAWAKNHKKWVASWRYDRPTLPSGWKLEDVLFWQYTDKGKLPGIAGFVDLNYSQLTKKELFTHFKSFYESTSTEAIVEMVDEFFIAQKGREQEFIANLKSKI